MAEQGQTPLKYRADARPKRPENFGALAGGTTDDKTPLIEWAASGGAGTVLELKPGATYRIASRGPLVFPAGSIVKGNGATILLDYTDTSNNSQIVTGARTQIEGLNVRWSGALYAERGINVGGDAAWVGGKVYSDLEQPASAQDEAQDATMTITGARGRIEGVTFENIWKPIRVNAADGKIKECDFYLFGKGIAVEAAATALVVEANRFHSLSSYGTQAPGEGPLTGAANGLTVRGNTIFAASEHGLYVSGDTLAVDVVIDSNTVFASGQSNYKTRNCDVKFTNNTAQDAAFGNSTGTTEDAAAFEDCPNVFVNGFTAAGRSKSNAGNYALRFDSCAKMAVSGVVTERAQESVILITDARIRAALGGYEHVSTLINGLTVQGPGAGRLMDIAFDGNCGDVEALGISFSGGSGTVLTTDIAGTAGKIMLQGAIDTTGTMHVNTAGGDAASIVRQTATALVIKDKTALAAISPAQFSGSVSTRINAAINAAASDGADVVLNGEYLVEGPILLQPGVKLIGMHSATLKRPDLSAGYDLMNLGTEGNDFALHGIAFNGNRAGQAVADYLGSLVILDSASTADVPNSSNLVINACKFIDFSRGAMGLHVKGFIGASVLGSYFANGGGGTLYHPLYLRRVRDVIVSGSTFKDVMFHAIKVQPIGALGRVVINGNVIDGAGRGVYVPDSANVSITGNVITNITGTGSGDGGIILQQDENAAGPSIITISGNAVSRVVGTGIMCNNTTGAVISGNSVSNCGQALINARASRDAAISGNSLMLNDLTWLVPDGIGGFVDPSTLTVAMIDVPTGPNAPRMAAHGNIYSDGTTATSVGIRTTATGGFVEYGPTEISQMSGMTTNISETTAGILQCDVIARSIKPQGQLTGAGSGMTIGQQGSAATWSLRGDVFQSINMVRDRASGTGAATLWRGWSSGDSATGWLAINPDTSPRIRTGNGLKVEDATGVDLLSIKSTGAVVGMAVAVASLPSAASNTYGRMFVSDSAVTAIGGFGSIVAGGGANKVPVWSDGTKWLIG